MSPNADGGRSVSYSENGLWIGLATDLPKEPAMQNSSED